MNYKNFRWQAVLFCSLSLSTLILAGCPNGPDEVPYGPAVVESLQVVPVDALGAAQAGTIEESLYSRNSSDTFLNDTYVIRGRGHADLSVYNGSADQKQLAINGKSIEVVDDTNGITETIMVVEAKDLSKIKTISVNGHMIMPADFVYGSPILPSGDTMRTGNRLPGQYALINIGALPASSDKPVEVILEGSCDATIHVDVFGKAFCNQSFTNNTANGTTIVLHTSALCDSTPDGGTPDAGCVGEQCAPHDGGTPDGGTPDAGCVGEQCTPHDGGTPDAGCVGDYCIPHDGGTPDAGCVGDYCTPHDGGTPDAGCVGDYCTPHDGGTLDGGCVGPSCVPNEGCTLTIGYWKTHAGFTGNNMDQVSRYLPIYLGSVTGSRSMVVDTAMKAKQILAQNFFGNPSNGITKLYAQLLGAKLNRSNGASEGAVASVIQAADAFLSTHDWNSWNSLNAAEQNEVLLWQSQLDYYNNGLIGPGHCS